MTCENALEAMLDADLSAMDSPLAMHLRGCGRCRRVADQLVSDTRLLASAQAQEPARQSRVPWIVAVPAALAAALLFMVTMREPVAIEQMTVTLPVQVEPAPVDSPNVERSPAPRVASAGQLRAFPRAQPMAASQLTVSAVNAPVASKAVTVTPPTGTTALVMHTSDPKLVVVWLY